MKRRIFIVGGVAAGASAATRARRVNPDAEITIFERSGYVSFANCGLPYYVGQIITDRNALLLQTPDGFKQRFNVDVRLHHEVETIDRTNRRIQVRNLKTDAASWETYDRLILAPGASAVRPPFPGLDSPNVFFLRSMEDTDAFRHYVDTQTVRRAAIVGAGFIGLETAEALAHRGIQVDVIELLPQVLAPLDADMAERVAVHLHDAGVALHLGVGVESLTTDGTRATQVVLQDGKTIDTDLVVMSIGVRPNVSLAQDAGLKLGPLGGILVNERMETSDPAILAAGDAVEVIHAVTGQPALIPLAGPANKHGRLAGEVAATDQGPPAPKVAGTAIVQVFGKTVAVTGLNCRSAKRAGLEPHFSLVTRDHHVGYYPGGEPMNIKLVYEPGSRRVLGAQIVGGAGVDRRIDIIATVIHFGGTLDDLAALDLAYAPQHGAAKDPVHIAAFVADNHERGLVRSVTVEEFAALREENLQLVDVRTPEDYLADTIPGAVNLCVDGLKDHADKLDPKLPILVFCSIGQRSYYAARTLAGTGRKDIINLMGGYQAYAIHERAQHLHPST